MKDTHDFTNNVRFQHAYMVEAYRILCSYMWGLVNFRLATEVEDTRQSTDAVLEVDGKVTIGMRVRRHKVYPNGKTYRDLTIRALSKGGGKTELAKMREGWCDWYFYGWLTPDSRLSEFMLLEIEPLRRSGLLFDNRPITMNGDGTGFVSYTLKELYTTMSLFVCNLVVDGQRRSWIRSSKAAQFELPAHLKNAVRHQAVNF